jgi:hypothetical protein
MESRDGEVEQWLKHLDSYTSLRDVLHELPSKRTGNVMVPVGSQAFFSGKLIHTNEVILLLGDNWFVETTVPQALKVLDHRLQCTLILVLNHLYTYMFIYLHLQFQFLIVILVFSGQSKVGLD